MLTVFNIPLEIIGHFYQRLFVPLSNKLKIGQCRPRMTPFQITTHFELVSIEKETGNCICGVHIETKYYFQNIEGGDLFIIGSECVKHWEKVNKYTLQNGAAKIEKYELESKIKRNVALGHTSCTFCGRNTSNSKCLKCTTKLKNVFNAWKSRILEKKRKKRVSDSELISIDVKYCYKDDAKELARLNNFKISWNTIIKTWKCPRMYAYHFNGFNERMVSSKK
jgi:hypothetical protein